MALQVSGQITVTSFDGVAAGAYHDIFVGRFEPCPMHTYGLDSYTYHLGRWLDKEKVGINRVCLKKRAESSRSRCCYPEPFHKILKLVEYVP